MRIQSCIRGFPLRRRLSAESFGSNNLFREIRERTLIAPNRCPPSLLRAFHERFWSLSLDSEKYDFFLELVNVLGVRRDCAAHAQEVLDRLRFSGNNADELGHLEDVAKLRKSVTPLYEEIFEGIAREVPGGCRSVVRMRGEVVRLKEAAKVKAATDGDGTSRDVQVLRRALWDLDEGMRQLLCTWFSVGNLDLRRLTYETASGAVLEHIARREAVHPIRTLSELKTRLGPGRRCFAFFHPSMPSDPLAFVHVALVPQIARSMDYINNSTGREELEGRARCAIFYSITSALPGLHGVELGNVLIKRVVSLLHSDVPQLETFVTLSPMPGLRNWINNALQSEPEQSFLGEVFHPADEKHVHNLAKDLGVVGFLESFSKKSSPRLLAEVLHELGHKAVFEASLRPLLVRLAKRYLVEEKRSGSLRALDPVANFHLRNGALVERINWAADPSLKGWKNSYGLMVNYLYDLDGIERRSHAYSTYGEVAVCRSLEG